jgi:hypothetical protein
VTSTTITGTLDVTYVLCAAIGIQPPSTGQLSLTKQ